VPNWLEKTNLVHGHAAKLRRTAIKIRKAVIPAAGWGTRFLPTTKTLPKEMLPLVDKPIIQYVVEEAVSCGVEMVIIVTSLGKRAMEDYFDRSADLEHFLAQKGQTQLLEKIRQLSSMVDIRYVRQKEQLGLGHAVSVARQVVGNEPFIVMLPDDLFEQQGAVLKRMLEVFERYRGSVIAVRRIDRSQVSRYGIIEPRKIAERVYQVRSMVEKPTVEQAPSDLAIVGRYVLTPEIFEELESTPPGAVGEIQITDGIGRLLRTQPVYAYEVEGEHYDAGTPLGWIQATIALALKHPEMGPAIRAYLKKLPPC
jgi:UTP--glucose-1-phosphate uridylyltransferase